MVISPPDALSRTSQPSHPLDPTKPASVDKTPQKTPIITPINDRHTTSHHRPPPSAGFPRTRIYPIIPAAPGRQHTASQIYQNELR